MICRLEYEYGGPVDQVDDGEDHIVALSPPLTDRRSVCMRFIDPYGLTVFNALQMDPLIEELTEARMRAPREAQEVLDRVVVLAGRCRERGYAFIRFIGD